MSCHLPLVVTVRRLLDARHPATVVPIKPLHVIADQPLAAHRLVELPGRVGCRLGEQARGWLPVLLQATPVGPGLHY